MLYLTNERLTKYCIADKSVFTVLHEATKIYLALSIFLEMHNCSWLVMNIMRYTFTTYNYIYIYVKTMHKNVYFKSQQSTTISELINLESESKSN